MINRFLSLLVIVYRGSKTTVMLCVYVLVSQGCCNKLLASVGMQIGVHFKLQRFLHRSGDQKSNKGHLRPSLLDGGYYRSVVPCFWWLSAVPASLSSCDRTPRSIWVFTRCPLFLPHFLFSVLLCHFSF